MNLTLQKILPTIPSPNSVSPLVLTEQIRAISRLKATKETSLVTLISLRPLKIFGSKMFASHQNRAWQQAPFFQLSEWALIGKRIREFDGASWT